MGLGVHCRWVECCVGGVSDADPRREACRSSTLAAGCWTWQADPHYGGLPRANLRKGEFRLSGCVMALIEDLFDT